MQCCVYKLKAYAAAGHGHAISGITGLQTALDGKSATGHTHDDRYYTESEMNTKLAGKANSSHTHDDRYYTESEMNAKLAAKADTTVSDLNVIQATRNINSAITPNGNSIASSPIRTRLMARSSCILKYSYDCLQSDYN